MTVVTTDRGSTPAAIDPAGWIEVCELDEFDLDRGGAVLVDGQQIAIFRLADVTPTDPSTSEGLYAVGNRDPFSGANVMARGIVGSAGPTVYVASPMYKQRFDLVTGRSLDDETVSIPIWPVRVVDGRIHLLMDSARG